MLLMDESLQLLSAVEVLDLSRNCFAEVANLQKCSRLRFLDLGFNHIANFSTLNLAHLRVRVLLLRNNALVNVKGIEQLVSLGVLDLSYNLIASVSDVEALKPLSQLNTLSLQGNPITLMSNYRIGILGVLADPRKVVLDGTSVTTKELWLFTSVLWKSKLQRPVSTGYDIAVMATEAISSPDSASTRGASRKGLRVAVIEDEPPLDEDEPPLDEDETSLGEDEPRLHSLVAASDLNDHRMMAAHLNSMETRNS
eukprot:TRINITY_DN675_c0_g1_i4.p1 TRINITY_DN675_c0_g1~~TRINITY_DN675_c0_g1_i4.p1  ORF type:complete len:254 (+),score=50.06 TRINITY_DN675_c0_g1_i4:128-889(+)